MSYIKRCSCAFFEVVTVVNDIMNCFDDYHEQDKEPTNETKQDRNRNITQPTKEI